MKKVLRFLSRDAYESATDRGRAGRAALELSIRASLSRNLLEGKRDREHEKIQTNAFSIANAAFRITLRMAEKSKKGKDKRSRRRKARRTGGTISMRVVKPKTNIVFTEVETSSDSDSDSNVSTKVEQTEAGAEESDVEMQDEASEATPEPAKTFVS